jgi:hypothetical protein|tara:strand:- start:2806 stop:3006 length:201 start_codon:yes stop_codon:yes gene_type:complete
MRSILLEAAEAYFQGLIKRHVSNVEVLLNRPAGIGEHQDIQESLEIELGKIADFHDKLEVIQKYFD